MAANSNTALPYHEPGIVTILILGGSLLALNIVNHIFDRIVSCGLVGQIFLGIAWGTPGAKWLSQEAESVIVNLGYLGLLLLVYEGGLSTSWPSLKANAILSSMVALTGISLPIALSYALLSLTNATPLQAFAAGAALCSTSLGTTFTVLSTSGLAHTRMGVVLTSAAMMDDVVGLVMVQVISNLGSTASSFTASTVIRPVFVSVAFLLAVPVVCRWVVKPLTLRSNSRVRSTPKLFRRSISNQEATFLVHTGILMAMITGASYAGTSNLFAAYLAGAAISWWDSELSHDRIITSRSTDKPGVRETEMQPMEQANPRQSSADETPQVAPRLSRDCELSQRPMTDRKVSGAYIYECYYAQPVQRILKPFFFASIGFSVPITQMFKGGALWRGLVYSLLMFLGKLACGLWLVRIPGLKNVFGRASTREKPAMNGSGKSESNLVSATLRRPEQDQSGHHALKKAINTASRSGREPRPNEAKKVQKVALSKVSKPISLYPACILGSAMTARGEIGFLISSLAESSGIFAQNGSYESETFLAVTWAILLCTIIGPLSVGLLVRRVRRLGKYTTGGAANGSSDARCWRVLGDWGVD